MELRATAEKHRPLGADLGRGVSILALKRQANQIFALSGRALLLKGRTEPSISGMAPGRSFYPPFVTESAIFSCLSSRQITFGG